MKIFNFLIKYRRDVGLIALCLVVFYWGNSLFNVKLKGEDKFQSKIDLIDSNINLLKTQQIDIDRNISDLKTEVIEVESTISSVKNQKVIIKEYYENKINIVDKFTDVELDSFFSNRYGRQYTY